MNSLSLDDRRDTQACLIDAVILGPLDVFGQPVPADRIPNVVGSCLLIEAGLETGTVESAGGDVEPVGDIALHQLSGLLFNRHPRE